VWNNLEEMRYDVGVLKGKERDRGIGFENTVRAVLTG